MRDLRVNTSFCPQILMYVQGTHVWQVVEKWTHTLLHNKNNKALWIAAQLTPAFFRYSYHLSEGILGFRKVVGTFCMLSQNAGINLVLACLGWEACSGIIWLPMLDHAVWINCKIHSFVALIELERNVITHLIIQLLIGVLSNACAASLLGEMINRMT